METGAISKISSFTMTGSAEHDDDDLYDVEWYELPDGVTWCEDYAGWECPDYHVVDLGWGDECNCPWEDGDYDSDRCMDVSGP